MICGKGEPCACKWRFCSEANVRIEWVLICGVLVYVRAIFEGRIFMERRRNLIHVSGPKEGQ